MVPYDKINIETPVSDAFQQAGLPWARYLISAGAVAGITSVLLVMMLSQPRVWLAMARDGMVPESFFGDVHPKFRTPWKATILIGVFVAVGAGLLPLRVLADLTNIGTLFAFVIVCVAVLIMRRLQPDAERPFRAPAEPLRARPGDPDLPDADVLAARRELVAAPRVAGHRARRSTSPTAVTTA